jgi:uncharacterized protein
MRFRLAPFRKDYNQNASCTLTRMATLCIAKNFCSIGNGVKLRNEERYENTVSHGKNYDAKNMMHVFRLLNMAEEIARYKKVNVKRPERELLLKIRTGEFSYEDLLKQADEKITLIHELFEIRSASFS